MAKGSTVFSAKSSARNLMPLILTTRLKVLLIFAEQHLRSIHVITTPASLLFYREADHEQKGQPRALNPAINVAYSGNYVIPINVIVYCVRVVCVLTVIFARLINEKINMQ